MAGYQEEIPTKKRWISLSLAERRRPKGARLVLTTDDKADEVAKGVVLVSTQRMNDWALKTFNDCQNLEIVCKF